MNWSVVLENFFRLHWLKTTGMIEINSLSAFILKALEQRWGDTHLLFYVFYELINNFRAPGAWIFWRDFSWLQGALDQTWEKVQDSLAGFCKAIQKDFVQVHLRELSDKWQRVKRNSKHPCYSGTLEFNKKYNKLNILKKHSYGAGDLKEPFHLRLLVMCNLCLRFFSQTGTFSWLNFNFLFKRRESLYSKLFRGWAWNVTKFVFVTNSFLCWQHVYRLIVPKDDTWPMNM